MSHQYMGNSRTNRQCKGEIAHHTIPDFALNWFTRLSMALILKIESAMSSLSGITRYSLSKFKVKVKHCCMFAISSLSVV